MSVRGPEEMRTSRSPDDPGRATLTAAAAEPDEWISWLRAFERDHGRPLRVLHIGNIANNAYTNAKIQRRFNIEADVACYDYYHIMGCPEWEDAEFEGDPGDPFFPDWSKVDLRGFVRPDWFAQGRLPTTQRYLLARRTNRRLATVYLGLCLRFDRWTRCRSTLTAYLVTAALGLAPPQSAAAPWPPSRPGQRRRRLSFIASARALARGGSALARLRLAMWTTRHRVFRGIALVRGQLSSYSRLAARKMIALVRAALLLARGESWRTAVLTVFPRRMSSVARTAEHGGLILQAQLRTIGADPLATREAVASFVAAARLAPDLVREISADALAPPGDAFRDHLDGAAGDADPEAAELDSMIDGIVSETRAHPLTPRFEAYFPDRQPPLLAVDVQGYEPGLPVWRKLFEHYDIIQGYSSDPIIPLLCDTPHFTAYEHGTLRAIPFEDSARGRICALCYRAAPAVFVTNSDVLPSARRLGLTDEQVVMLPHAVDSQKILRHADTHTGLAPARGGIVTFFSPTRHDWVVPDPNLNKLNDRAIRALAAVRDEGLDWRATFVSWGRDVEASQALIESLSLGDRIEWIEPVRKRRLWERYLMSHAVLDQFMAPAIGGVTLEAMALGRRVITALDVPGTTAFFGAELPLYAASSVEEIVAALRRVIVDPDDEDGLGMAAQDWFRRWHSEERIVRLQVDAYRRMVIAPGRPMEVGPGY